MGMEILRKVDEDYFDYDGDEDEDPVDEEWEMFNNSYNW